MLSVTIHATDVSAVLTAYLDVSKTDKGGQKNQATHSTLAGELSFRRLYNFFSTWEHDIKNGLCMEGTLPYRMAD